MSEPTPGRALDDDLGQAYARSHALAGDGRGPSASVRANVLAAAARIAAGQGADAPPLVPVAPPVAALARKRGPAVNLSSWRVRAGAALCALLLVGAGVWRFDQNGRLGGGVQVALAELRLAQPRTSAAPAPQALPLPAPAAASYPYAPPPAVVVDPFDGSAGARGAVARHAEREREVVVAQLDEQRAAAPRQASPVDGLAPSSRAAPPAPARPTAAADVAAPPRPVALASNAPRTQGKAAGQESATVTITAAAPAAPPAIMTSPPRPPSALPRRMMLVPRSSPEPATPAAPAGNTVVAAADADGFSAGSRRAAVPSAPSPVAKAAAAAAPVVVAGAAAAPPEPMALAKPDLHAASEADALKRSTADMAGLVPASVRPDSLPAAADRGDVEALKALLAGPAARVDAPDADGRTALLHAVLAQRPEAVRLLLAAGADPGRADRTGLTPRQAAQAGASAEIAALLGTAPR
ncbi:MAG: ankyrin repeat domain-containing protein [Burkholderiales bacterium]|nr:ankyrin repeat domain-containing protein [Burkholderiales bacterium]